MEITFPANAAEFYKRAILFANMDLLSGEKLYEVILSFRSTPPLSPKFEELDYEDLTFIMNSGSFFILLTLILLEPLGRFFITQLCLLFKRFKACRSVGIYFHKKSLFTLTKEGSLRLFMESYFEFCMCASLNFVSFLSSPKLRDHFQTVDDSLNSMIALVFLVGVPAFPLWAAFIIHREVKATKRNPTFGLFTEEFDTSSPLKAQYQSFFLARRLSLVAILVFMRGEVFFQCTFVTHLSLLNLVYLTYVQPFKDEQSNRLEAFNELTVLFSSTLIMTFLNAGSELTFREFSGWLLIGTVCLNIGVNLISVGYKT
mmetsp:Transcript_17852/g.27621  ORF Transcript_17852/g.27621 Transcript_17852/m.27621 type:complete len:315 (-) Transcript_17852:321-1265(-)